MSALQNSLEQDEGATTDDKWLHCRGTSS
jgi:hypothetical protein